MAEETIPDWWLFRCKCGQMLVRYPFISCSTCGQQSYFSERDRERLEKEGKLMTLVDYGYGEPIIEELRKKHGDFKFWRA